ncbi:zinc ABC transporter substrate-binding protein [Brevibacillus ruminantium]|uniref:Zinc ABC transporter substrate-binding protein n=1 Tax=Brevibacillus ruminantium TaxID=2950604 RepID=A0ABY4WKQ3_9BACL|nr:zinc ABC transporter substrate-binding protein [Brevibacillus ruminantium]USG65944.1 zinc ABC transporter substrate-binding protein [Brevibacillus ruminantium]
MKKTMLALLGVITAAAMAGCGAGTTANTTPQTSSDTTSKIKVFTTLYPLEYAAKRIAGDHAEVVNLVPPGVEPHDFEPTAKDMVALSGSDLFVYNGSGFEAWIDKAVENLDKNKTIAVNATEGLSLLEASGHDDHDHDHDHSHEGEAAEKGHDEHKEGSEAAGHDEHKEGSEAAGHADHKEEAKASEEHGHDHDHDHGDTDPHVWLDPTMLKAQAEKIKAALAEKDKANAEAYEKNYQQLAADLDQLDKDFKDMVRQSSKKEFLVSHSAFAYLAHRYGLEQVAISGINPASEPSPADMKRLVEYVKEHEISHVLFETLASPKVADVIAKEAKLQTGTLNPLEGLTEDEAKAGKDYLSIMKENLEMLRTVLK